MPKEERVVWSREFFRAVTAEWKSLLARQLDSPAVLAKQARVAEQDALIGLCEMPFGGIPTTNRPPQQ